MFICKTANIHIILHIINSVFSAKLRFNFTIIFIEENYTIITILLYYYISHEKLLSFPLASGNGFGFKIDAVLFESHKTESSYCEFVITIVSSQDYNQL